MWPKNFTYMCVCIYTYIYMWKVLPTLYFLHLWRDEDITDPQEHQVTAPFCPRPAIISVPEWLHVKHGFSFSAEWELRFSPLEMRLPKASPTCVPEASAGTTNEQPSAQLQGGMGSGRNQSLYFTGKTKLAILHQCQVAQSLIRAGLSPLSFQATDVCHSFLSINSSPSDPPPKGWHFYLCFSGNASLPFLKQHVQKLQATGF